MRWFSAAAVVALVLLAGCSSKGTTSSSSSPSPKQNVMVMEYPIKTVDVKLESSKFVNQTITIYAGDSVKWTNKDPATTPHNVGADDGSWDSNPYCESPTSPSVPPGTPPPLPTTQVCMAQGGTFTHMFSKVGDVTYNCRVHKGMGMTGTIHVIPRATYNMTG